MDKVQPQPDSGGGWISGACNEPIPQPMTAKLPEYNPVYLVMRVQDLLKEDGVHTYVDLFNSNTAVNAAADLLRALSVSPSNAPRQPE